MTVPRAPLGAPPVRWRVVVVGAGPAGVFAVDRLREAGVCVDVVEAMPTPHGLVRYGVAPDHPRTKAVTRVFDRILADPMVTFYGNVRVGPDVSVNELRERYDAVVIATGAPATRSLGIPGEELAGSFAAGDLVNWYNGHPDAEDQGFLAAREVAVVGGGNVALDVARMLVTDAAELVGTDVPENVLTAWRANAVADVHVLCRKGAAQARFTSPELHELGELAGVDIVVDAAELDHDAEVTARHSKMLERLREWSERPLTGASRRLHLHFGATPVAILGDDGVACVRIADAAHPGKTRDLPVGAVFRAIGYTGLALPGVPFDDASGRVPNERGRITGLTGVYVAGWIKRGPSGVIGTNKSDAAETVAALLTDLEDRAWAPAATDDALEMLLAPRGVRPVSWQEWGVLDSYEGAQGAGSGRGRVKLASREEMLTVARP